MPFTLITSLLAQSYLPHFDNMVLELLAPCELAKPGEKSIMKKDRESKARVNWSRMRIRIRLRMRPRMRT